MAVAAVLAVGCNSVQGNGHIVEQTPTVGAFEQVSVHQGIAMTVRVGSEQSVKVRGDENLLELVRMEVRDGVLETVVPPNTTLVPSEQLQVEVVAPSLTGVSASGGSSLTATGLPAVDDFTVNASGGSTVTLSGEGTPRLTLSASGGSQLDLGDFPVARLEVQASGGSVLEVSVSESVTGGMSGGSRMTGVGQPSVQVDLSGGSTVELE
jgi:hypothetical protein